MKLCFSVSLFPIDFLFLTLGSRTCILIFLSSKGVGVGNERHMPPARGGLIMMIFSCSLDAGCPLQPHAFSPHISNTSFERLRCPGGRIGTHRIIIPLETGRYDTAPEKILTRIVNSDKYHCKSQVKFPPSSAAIGFLGGIKT